MKAILFAADGARKEIEVPRPPPGKIGFVLKYGDAEASVDADGKWIVTVRERFEWRSAYALPARAITKRDYVLIRVSEGSAEAVYYEVAP